MVNTRGIRPSRNVIDQRGKKREPARPLSLTPLRRLTIKYLTTLKRLIKEVSPATLANLAVGCLRTVSRGLRRMKRTTEVISTPPATIRSTLTRVILTLLVR
jgi:hypothetical protein